MDLSKASTRNTWQAVNQATREVRNGQPHPALGQWFEQRGFPLDDTVFSSICCFDDGIYTGTLVDARGHAWEFMVDVNTPQASFLDDVTAELGPKAPDHPNADPCDRITMALCIQRDALTV